jgi:hypothetical protein
LAHTALNEGWKDYVLQTDIEDLVYYGTIKFTAAVLFYSANREVLLFKKQIE